MKRTQKKLLSLLLSILFMSCMIVSPCGAMTAEAAKANHAWSGTTTVASPINPSKEVTATFNFYAESPDNGKHIWFTEDSIWSVSADDFDGLYCAYVFVPNNSDFLYYEYFLEDSDGTPIIQLNKVYTDNNCYFYETKYNRGQPMPMLSPGLVDFIKKSGPGELSLWLTDGYIDLSICNTCWYWSNFSIDKIHLGDTAPSAEPTGTIETQTAPAETPAAPETTPAAEAPVSNEVVTASPTAEEIVAQFDVSKTYTAEQAAAVVKDFVDGLKALGVSIAPEFTEQVTAVNPVLGQALMAALGQTPSAETPAASAPEKEAAAPAAPAAQEAQASAGPVSGTYTVEKGDNLFKIAQKAYGDGKLWKKIYEANKDQIRNTKEYIIYAGQNFVIPTIQ